MTHNTNDAKTFSPLQIGNAITSSINVQNALDLLLTTLRYEVRKAGFGDNDILKAIDDDPLRAEIEALIVARFASDLVEVIR